MTPDELEYCVLEAPHASDLQSACENLSEVERAKLSTAAQKLYAQLTKSQADKSASPRLLKFLKRYRSGPAHQYWNDETTRRARLALFALCPLSVVRKGDLFLGPEDRAVFQRIVLDRRPAWLDDWIAHDLERDWQLLDFATLRAWIRNGVCAKPEVDGYYRMFAGHMMRLHDWYGGPKPRPISLQILDDPDLLDDIPGLFRVESIAFNTNSWFKPADGRDHESWPEALVKLSTQGHIRRERLLDLCLEGLTRDLKQNQLSGFHGLYRRMAADADELLRDQPRYIDIMCHPVGHVVKFAIDMLAEIEKRGALDTEPVLREIQVVFSSEGKGNATSALKLVGRIITRQKAAEPAALAAVAEALRHAHADVQAQALGMLETWAAHLDGDQRAALADMAPFMAASNRNRLAALAASGAPADAGVEGASASAVRGPWDGAAYQPLAGDISEQTILFREDRIAPIATVDELLATVLHAVEVVDSPDEVERIIDGISRLAGERPDDLDDRAAPVLHRLKNNAGATKGLASGFSNVPQALLDLLHTWLTDRRRTPYSSREDTFEPVLMHLRAITERVALRHGQQLLSAPTHKGGWIDPAVWVERVRAAQDRSDATWSMDFRLSLLRLAPDNRAVALEQAATLAPAVRRIVRFALGGDERPERADRDNYSTWITAARCRATDQDWRDAFAPLGLEDEWPGALRPARYEWRTDHEVGQSGNLRWKTPKFEMRVVSDGPDASPAATTGLLGRIGQALGARVKTNWAPLPTVALSRRVETRTWSGDLDTAWVTRWLIYIWPQNPGPAYMKAAKRLTDRIDEGGSNWSPNFGYFHGLFQRNRPWREPGHLLLALGLIGKDADARGLAVDALIEGIEGRLFDPALFAATMTRLAEGEWVKFNRLGDSLAMVIAVSDLHAAVVADALQRWLPTLDLQQNGAFRLLEVLVEALAMTPVLLGSDAQEALRKVPGAGKAAKLAKQLLRA